METRIYSKFREVIIDNSQSTVLIGERINPNGRKKMTEALAEGNLEFVGQEALSQVQAGADIIDVNVGAFGLDEVALLPRAVKVVMNAVDVPLCIDSANPEALAAAIKIYQGKPLINSVTGEEHSLSRVLPLAHKYGAAVIGLTQDDKGIPQSQDRRVSIAQKIVQRAESLGIPREDIMIDCLAFAVGADSSSGQVTLETVRSVKSELGVNLVLGASNVSFGLPDRNVINNTFIAILIAAGVSCLIADVARVRPTVLAADLLIGHDRRARRYIEAYRQRQAI